VIYYLKFPSIVHHAIVPIKKKPQYGNELINVDQNYSDDKQIA